MTKNHKDFLELAFKEALKARDKDEVPVGAVFVRDGKVIAKAHNLREQTQSVFKHAELIAVEKAQKKLKTWRLSDVDVYVTLEPCPMCAAVFVQSRIRNVYFGAFDVKAGAVSLDLKLQNHPKLNHRYGMIPLLDAKCSEVLTEFFSEKRKKKKKSAI